MTHSTILHGMIHIGGAGIVHITTGTVVIGDGAVLGTIPVGVGVDIITTGITGTDMAVITTDMDITMGTMDTWVTIILADHPLHA